MMTKGKIRIFLALFVLSVFIFQNCATIARGTSQKIPVTSNPIGAKIIVDGEEMGYAPLNLKLKRKKSHVIRIEKQGYNPLEIGITKKTSKGAITGSMGGNFLLGIPIGVLIGLGVYGVRGGHEDEDIFTAAIVAGVGVIIGWAGGAIVDVLSGANYTLSPEELNVTLTKMGES